MVGSHLISNQTTKIDSRLTGEIGWELSNGSLKSDSSS